jgi:hypothetical protein
MSRLFAVAAVGLVAACGGDETQPAGEHTPATYNLIVNDVPQTEPYVLTAGQSSRVQIKFFTARGEDLDEVEAEHFGGLSFNPSSLAIVTRLADHHYQFDVTPEAVGGGTLQVGFGHDDAANEKVFPPAAVNVMGGASGPN